MKLLKVCFCAGVLFFSFVGLAQENCNDPKWSVSKSTLTRVNVPQYFYSKSGHERFNQLRSQCSKEFTPLCYDIPQN